MKVPRNHPAGGAAITGLFMSIVIVFLIVDRPISGAAAPEDRSIATQSLFFPYFTVKDGFNSTVGFNNASNLQLTIHPTLYNASGQSFAINPITLGARQQFMANIRDWIIESTGDVSFTKGNLSLSYEAPGPAYLGSQITITNPASSLVFDVSDEDPASYSSSRLEGLWWRPDGASQYDLIMTNTTDGSVEVETSFTGDQRLPTGESLNLTLEPHQIRALNLKDVKLPLSTGNGEGKMGGISITHSGKPGAVLAYGMLAKSESGFSSNFAFADPAVSQSQTLAAAHLLIGRAEMERFSRNTSFTSIALLRNASDAPIEVKPTVSFTSNKEPRTARLRSRELLPQQVEAVDIEAELKRAGYHGLFVGAGLTLASTGQAGTLAVHLSSFDQTRNHVFDVPLKDPAVRSSRFGGCYPWNIEGDTQSITHVRNTTDEKALFTIQLDWDGGSYALPIQELAPQQEVAIDIRKLRDTQEEDSTGRVIPNEVSRGQATWYEHGEQALIGRMEIFSTSKATASSFSCEANCCPPSTFIVVCLPDSMSGLVGGVSLVQLMETRRRDCDGAQFGPFNVTTQASWSSTNTSVVTVGSVTQSGAQCACVGLGQADVKANFTGMQWEFGFSSCFPIAIPILRACPVTVFQLKITVPDTTIFFEASANSASIVAGETFGLVVEAVDSLGIVVPVNKKLSVAASRTLASNETGLPSTIKLVDGRYVNSLLLNRINATDRGTSYRFSTGNAFTDFFLYTYFRVFSTREGQLPNPTQCGYRIQPNDHLVALPVRDLCNLQVVVSNPTTGQSDTAPKKDAGPHFPGGNCDPSGTVVDPYWNTGTRPKVESLTCESGNNNAGIDLGDGTYAAVGSPAQVVWRWQ
jgi:hypothetical protein